MASFAFLAKMDASLSPAAGFTPSASPPVLLSPAVFVSPAVLLSLEPVLLKPPPSGSNFASSFGRSLGLLGANASVSISDMRSLTALPNAVDGDAHWSSKFVESSRFLPTEPGVAIEPAAIAATASSASPKEGSRASRVSVGLEGLSSSMLLDGVSNTSQVSSSVSSSSSSREISTFSSPFFGLVGVELDVPVPHDLRTSGMTSGAGGEIAAGEAGDPISLSDLSSFSFSGDADFE